MGTNLGYLGAAQATLAAWQTATGQDANSISADPLFVSTTDLHLSGPSSPAVDAGTPIAGITIDIDGDTRSATTPDIGADEPPPPTPTPTPTDTPAPPTATPTDTPTNTPAPPTATPTDTPTNTPAPPTATPTDTPTNTPAPPTATPTDTPTNTPVPPTATPTDTPTNTPEPPTATPTNTPVAGVCGPVTIDPNVAIPDGNPAGICFPIVVNDVGVVSNVTVQTAINHTWIGDLDFRLYAPVDRPSWRC
ncbi:MAG: hypothetical protein HZY76_13270 [Anaerolineae bacterium]|nr:MAG: hypothetical protein HZY76_13270 [Anaerolineae bacterium]